MSANATDPIDTLLDEAFSYRDHRLNNAADVTSPPDFTYTPITSFSDFARTVDGVASNNNSSIEVKDTIFRGRGLYATKDISEGNHLIVAKPLVMVMSWEVSDDEDEIDSEDELDEDIDAEEDLIDADLDSADEEGLEEFEDTFEGEEEGDDDDSEEEDVKVAAKPDSKHTHDDSDVDDDSIDGSMPSGEKRNGVLVLRLLDKIKKKPKLWTDTLSQLFPRDEETSLNLPPWMCSCVKIGLEIDQNFNDLLDLHLFPDKDNEETCKDIQLRLPLIVRYNVLSVETAPEQYSHFDAVKGMVELNGTALYGPEVSYLNHSCEPNLSRMSIGDVMFFVTNRNISSGEELCFSYIEHELLCESEEKRTAVLDMDFKDYTDNDEDDSNEAASKKQKVAAKKNKIKVGPMIDALVQNEIMSTQAFERLELILDLLNNPEQVEPEQDFQCDKYTLHSLHAITLDQLGRSTEALSEWQACLKFATKNFPAVDETTMNLHVQAALCAKHAKKLDIANIHAKNALEMHDKLWGGGKVRFLKRYEDDFSKPLRPISKKQMALDVQELFA